VIIPVYQPQGSSSHQLAQQIGNQRGEKATHTGTLDPMAEGVLLVLTGEDRFKKETLSAVQKTYQFEILWGVKTDSEDLLGLVANDSLKRATHPQSNPSLDQLEKALTSYVGRYKQQIPTFSAKRLAGKSLFDFAKDNKKTPDYFQEVELFSGKVLVEKTVLKDELKAIVMTKINRVEGDFRQEAIVSSWFDFFEKTSPNQFHTTKIEIVTSKRFYVRGLVRDLSRDVGVPATTFSIVRTKNGVYGLKDCQV
jgi:tRNA pseudouridine55 synthase